MHVVIVVINPILMTALSGLVVESSVLCATAILLSSVQCARVLSSISVESSLVWVAVGLSTPFGERNI